MRRSCAAVSTSSLRTPDVDIGPVGYRRGEVGLGLFNGGGELGTAQHGKNVSLAHLLSGAHPIGRHAAVYFRRDADFGLVHDAR